MSLSCLKRSNDFPFTNIPRSPSCYSPTSRVSYSPFSLSLMKHEPHWFFPASGPLYYMYFLLGRLFPSIFTWFLLVSPVINWKYHRLREPFSYNVPNHHSTLFHIPILYYSENVLLLKILSSCVYCLHSPH